MLPEDSRIVRFSFRTSAWSLITNFAMSLGFVPKMCPQEDPGFISYESDDFATPRDKNILADPEK